MQCIEFDVLSMEHTLKLEDLLLQPLNLQGLSNLKLSGHVRLQVQQERRG